MKPTASTDQETGLKRWTGRALCLAVGIHVLGLLIAGFVVALHAVSKPPVEFEASASSRPRLDPRKIQPRVTLQPKTKSSARTLARKPIVSTSVSDLPLPTVKKKPASHNFSISAARAKRAGRAQQE